MARRGTNARRRVVALAAVAMVGALALLAACGDNREPPDAPPSAPTCMATWSGNLVETDIGSATCPTLAGSTLTFAIPSTTLDTSLAIAIDLPSASTGTYTSETVTTWSASAVQRIGDGGCDYSAGGSAVPQGSFTLVLDDVSGAIVHGSLALALYVLVFPETECGMSPTEMVDVQF